MIRVRRSASRGHFDHGWLDTYHTFSFDAYHDPAYMGFRSLRVINEDRVQAGKGFPEHAHRDMEILTYVLEGALEHRDSLGNGSVIRAGDLQRMSAGTGIRHSEFNGSQSEAVHFLQIWILPDRSGGKPGYEQVTPPAEGRRGTLQLVAAQGGRKGAVAVQQDARVYLASLEPGQSIEHRITLPRHAWVQVTRGSVAVNDHALDHGDGVALSDEERMVMTAAREPAEVVMFDLS